MLESFAGYGSQSISLRDVGVDHEVIGISEIEPDAIIAYGSIRFDLADLYTDKTHEEMKKELMAKNVGWDFQKNKSRIPRMKKDKLEMLYKFDKASNNFGDISLINPTNLPDFDYFTMSFPCQSISVSGKQEGIIKGETRSGLLYECERIIEGKKPKYILMENVKNLVGKKFKDDFDKWCEYLESHGYTNYWKVLNSKDFGIAQNRERVFMISILGEHDEFKFPQGFKLEKRLKDFLENDIEEKYYLKNTKNFFIDNSFNMEKKGNGFRFSPHVEKNASIAKTITTRAGGRMDDNFIIDIESENTNFKFCSENLESQKHDYNDFRIRKLTPKECLRLMGLLDEDISKIQNTGLSDSSLYKLAGNSIVKQCLDHLHINMFSDIENRDNTPS